MSASSGPSIQTDGLVFDYDMSNTQKSFIGKPTTNLVITKVENYTGWTGAGWWMHPGNTTSITSQTLPNGDTGPTLTATTLTTGGLYGYNGYALGAAYVNGTQYTVSFWAKSYNGTPSLAVRDADSGGTLSTGVTGITSVWTRFSFTWTANASTNMLTFTGSNFSLYNVQLETNSFATPFVVGTRSSTQAIVDLTGRNTITASSLTYAADNTFSFNGSGNYISVSYSSILNTPGGATYSIWLYPTGSSGEFLSRGTSDGGATPDNPRFYIDTAAKTFYLDWSTPGSDKYVTTSANSYPSNNTWINVVGTATPGGRLDVYVNGTVCTYSTRAGADAMPSPLPNTTDPIQIGGATWIPRYFTGNISAVLLYNRVLSATEIQQNFNAHRSRYGI